MTSYTPAPEQPDGIDPANDELPRPGAAANRIARFLEWYGDGIIEIGSPTPGQDNAPVLYARDLQALLNVITLSIDLHRELTR